MGFRDRLISIEEYEALERVEGERGEGGRE